MSQKCNLLNETINPLSFLLRSQKEMFLIQASNIVFRLCKALVYGLSYSKKHYEVYTPKVNKKCEYGTERQHSIQVLHHYRWSNRIKRQDQLEACYSTLIPFYIFLENH